MKKVLLFFVGVLMLFTLTGCSKTSLTTENVKSIASNRGLGVVDVKSQFEGSTQIIEANVIQDGTLAWQVEFYVLDNVDNAISMFNTNVVKFEQYETGANAKVTVSGKNYDTYSLTTTDRYRYLSRVDNTLLYADVDINQKDNVKAFVEELGY